MSGKPDGFLYTLGHYLSSQAFIRWLNSHAIHADEIGLFLQTMGVILVSLGISLLALSQLEINAKEPKYKEDYNKWERLWYCSHCRNTFYDT